MKLETVFKAIAILFVLAIVGTITKDVANLIMMQTK